MLRGSILLLALTVGALSSEDENSLRFAKANNVFGINLLKALPQNKSHVFISPLSISMAMSMVYQGARGISETELSSVLGYDAAGLRGREALSSAMLKLLQDPSLQNTSVILDIANAALVNRDFPLVESYTENLRDIYQALLKEVDFVEDSRGIVSEVNQWVSQKTRGKITSVINELSPDVVLLIMNAVYFKGDWESKFLESQTTKLPFYNRGEVSELVDTMAQTGRFRYTNDRGLRAQIIELPYAGNRFSMLIFLPNELNGLNDLLSQLTASKFQEAAGRMRTANVQLRLPKFKLDSEYSLVDTLKNLGVNSIFGTNANLTGVSNVPDLVVSDVIHKVVVEVNEEGSEAAATTAVLFAVRSGGRSLFEYYVNHPFLFFIRDRRTNMILFSGAVNEL